jgi:osmotically-inducible protein OsmY
MKTATFLIMGALSAACAHRAAPAETEVAQATPVESKSQALTEAKPAPDDGHSGGVLLAPGPARAEPRIGELELANAPAAPRAEAASTNGERSAGKSSAPRAIEPAAPTVATAPPGSALTPAAPEAASKDEAELRARIQSTLLRDANLSFTAKRVRVEIERGRVTLLGEVRTAREKNEVEDLVEKVSGVRRVTNRLAVIDQAAMTQAATTH